MEIIHLNMLSAVAGSILSEQIWVYQGSNNCHRTIPVYEAIHVDLYVEVRAEGS